MIITISDFRRRVLEGGIATIISILKDETGRSNPEEINSWRESLAQVARVLAAPELEQFHLFLGQRSELALEYRLPASSSWCDVVLLGQGPEKPTAVILELKHWDTRGDTVGVAEGLITHAGRSVHHPSDQVGGYVEYCRRFHSATPEGSAIVDGCVLFTERSLNPVYVAQPNEKLTRDFPCFGVPAHVDGREFINFLRKRLTKPAPDFARAFEHGHYSQTRGFIQAIGAELRNRDHRSLVLLDEQREGLRVAIAQTKTALASSSTGAMPSKRVLIVQGPPGSGKSAVAAHLWAELAGWPDLPPGDLVFVSTSTAQNHAWKHLFGQGEGAVKAASHFSPTTTQRLGQLQARFPLDLASVDNWRQNLMFLKTVDGEFRTKDDCYLISIIDEAHALVNPESKDARGPLGFPLHFGPLGYHAIRSSSLTVFFLDEAQSFREHEATSIKHLVTWATELGAVVLPIISLAGKQFRCGGSVEYVTWVEQMFSGCSAAAGALLTDKWRARKSILSAREVLSLAAEATPNIDDRLASRRFGFEIVPTLQDLDAALRLHVDYGDSVRLVSSYARKWVTEKAATPHALPPHAKDFYFPVTNGRPEWSRIWNWKNAPRGYVSWIDSGPGDPMHSDSLCEVGCPYTVRGFDYDCLGIIWLSDVVWRENRWIAQPEEVHERGLKNHNRRAIAEKDTAGPAHAALIGKLIQGYRILLTRAVKGVYVWCEDEQTKDRLRDCLGISG